MEDKISIKIPDELFTTFNDVIYHDEPHKYYVGDGELISVTTVIHQYQNDFNENKWSKYKADELNIPQKDIIRAWRFINKKGTMKGSIIHNETENLFLNKVFPYPKHLILEEFGFDPIQIEYDITKKHVLNFYNRVKGILIPIRTEMIIYDKESLIGGMLDMLFYNTRTQQFEIWDYKTNKKFTRENCEQKLLHPFKMIDDCDLEIYSIQLALYKLIIEKNTGIKLGKSYVVWFSHNNENYEIIPTCDRDNIAEIIMNNRIKELRA